MNITSHRAEKHFYLFQFVLLINLESNLRELISFFIQLYLFDCQTSYEAKIDFEQIFLSLSLSDPCIN